MTAAYQRTDILARGLLADAGELLRLEQVVSEQREKLSELAADNVYLRNLLSYAEGESATMRRSNGALVGERNDLRAEVVRLTNQLFAVTQERDRLRCRARMRDQILGAKRALLETA